MKKNIHPGVLVGSIVAALAICGILLWKTTSGPADFPAAKRNPGVPDYIKSKMSPEMQQKLAEQGVDTKVSAQAPANQTGGGQGR